MKRIGTAINSVGCNNRPDRVLDVRLVSKPIAKLKYLFRLVVLKQLKVYGASENESESNLNV